jgi:hypothetical protein
MRNTELETATKRHDLEGKVKLHATSTARARLSEMDKQIDTLEAEFWKATDAATRHQLALRWGQASEDRDSLRKQVADLDDAVNGPRRLAAELDIANATKRIEELKAEQEQVRRDMASESCDRELRPPVQRAAPDPILILPTRPSTDQATAPLPPLPPPADVAQPTSQPGQTATTATSGLPPLPSLPSADTGQPSPQTSVATAGGLPPLPPMDDFLIPPRPSTLTQPPIVEPLPVAGLPPLPPPPSVASAPPSTEVIRVPVIRAPNVSAPPIVIPRVHAPPIHAPVVRAPPINIPQVHAPRVRARVVRAPPIHAPNIRAPTIRTRQVAPRSTPRVVYTQPRRPDFSGLAARARAIGSIGRVPAPTGRRWGR